MAWPRPIEQNYNSPNFKVKLVKGDLFDQSEHLVIGMSDTFDTEVPYIIARNSVQGQFINRIYDDDREALEADLTDATRELIPVEVIDKPGKRTRYPLGSVAVLRDRTRCYFCVAYTSMNEKNEARATVDGVWRSLDRLWKSISENANGGSVAIPVIGGGQSRLSQILPAQHAIRLMILSFYLASRTEKVCDELVIVSQPAQYDALDRMEIQAFLKSLKPS